MPTFQITKLEFPFAIDERMPMDREQILPITRQGIVDRWDVRSGHCHVPVWVYGTLRSDGWNNPVLGSHARFVCNAWLASNNWALTNTNPNVPFLAPNRSDCKSHVFGELWSVRYMDVCNHVDRLEGCHLDREDGIYRRSLAGVQIIDDNRYDIKRLASDCVGYEGVGGIVDAIVYACPSYNADRPMRYGLSDERWKTMHYDWNGTRYYDYDGEVA